MFRTFKVKVSEEDIINYNIPCVASIAHTPNKRVRQPKCRNRKTRSNQTKIMEWIRKPLFEVKSRFAVIIKLLLFDKYIFFGWF